MLQQRSRVVTWPCLFLTVSGRLLPAPRGCFWVLPTWSSLQYGSLPFRARKDTASWMGDQIHVLCTDRWIFNHWTTREGPLRVHVQSGRRPVTLHRTRQSGCSDCSRHVSPGQGARFCRPSVGAGGKAGGEWDKQQTQVVLPAHLTPRQTAVWAVFEHR